LPSKNRRQRKRIRKKHNSAQEQGGAEQSQNEPPREPTEDPGADVSRPSKVPSAKREEGGKIAARSATEIEKSNLKIANRAFWVNTTGAAILLLYAATTVCLYCETRKSNRVAQRPFVYLDRIEFRVVDRVLPPEKAPNVVIWNAYNNTKKVVAVTFFATNSGNTPTSNLRAFVDCHHIGPKEPAGTLAPPTDDPFVGFRWDDAGAKANVIGPHQTTDIGQCDLSDENILNSHMGIDRTVFRGELRYDEMIDPGASPHAVQFERELVVLRREFESFAAETRAVGRHNCTDANCPRD
jgi:hypothetical protein